MSVYPKRLRRSETVFIHVRVCTRLPRRPLMRVLLEDPAGKRTEIHRFHPWAFPVAPVAAIEAGSLPGSLQRVSPVYLLARHLVGADGDPASMLGLLEKTQQSTHFHLSHTLSSEALLGRYQVHIEMRSNTRMWVSDTLADAYFHVEELNRVCALPAGSGGGVEVFNPGPVDVPACMVSIDGDTMWRRGMVLAPGSTTLHCRGSRGYLLYSEDRHVLALDDAESPLCIRNEMLTWRDDPVRQCVLIHGPAADAAGWTLTGVSRGLWLAADGMTLRVALRVADAQDEYDAMLDEGLLYEIDASAFETGHAVQRPAAPASC